MLAYEFPVAHCFRAVESLPIGGASFTDAGSIVTETDCGTRCCATIVSFCTDHGFFFLSLGQDRDMLFFNDALKLYVAPRIDVLYFPLARTSDVIGWAE